MSRHVGVGRVPLFLTVPKLCGVPLLFNILAQDAGMYLEARQLLDEGEAYISMPTQQKVMAKVKRKPPLLRTPH